MAGNMGKKVTDCLGGCICHVTFPQAYNPPPLPPRFIPPLVVVTVLFIPLLFIFSLCIFIPLRSYFASHIPPFIIISCQHDKYVYIIW